MIFPSPIHALTWLSSTLDSSQVLTLLTKPFTCDGTFCPSDFEVDGKTGFFPSAPLPQLPDEYAIWEAAFAAASSVLALGDDKNEEALSRRSDGAWWRTTVRSVSLGNIQMRRGH